MRARVVSSSVSSCRILLDGEIKNAVLKGKVLKNVSCDDTSPLSAGDVVEVLSSDGRFLISERMERISVFRRYNFLKKKNQVIGANFDVVCPVVSHSNPELNEYFANTVLSGLSGRAEVMFIASKSDLPFSAQDEQSFADLTNAGFSVLRVSALEGDGMDELRNRIQGRTALFVGESGSGKSRLLNSLFGKEIQMVGDVSQKNNKGSHTTSSSFLYASSDFSCIDTPGVRYVLPLLCDDLDESVLFPEFLNFNCRFSDCKHIDESGCAVREAVEKHLVSDRRYGFYIKLRNSAKKMLRRPYELQTHH